MHPWNASRCKCSETTNGRPTMKQASSRQASSPFTQANSESQLAPIGLYWDHNSAVIICTSCQYALQPRGERVSRHLGEKHGVPVQARAGFTAFLAELVLPDPNHIDLLPDWTAPHPHLAVQTGASCKRRHFRSTSLELVKRHVSKSHRWASKYKDWSREYIHCGVCWGNVAACKPPNHSLHMRC